MIIIKNWDCYVHVDNMNEYEQCLLLISSLPYLKHN